MNTKSITDLFFDLDDTLWDFQTNSAAAFAAIFDQHQLPFTTAQFLPLYRPINERYWQLYRDGEISKTELRLNRLSDTFHAMKVEVSADLVQQIADDFNRNLNNYTSLMPGVIDTLDYLYPRYNLHILTNGFTEVQDTKLKNSKLSPYFKTVTASEESGAKKPDPAIFAQALNRAQADKATSVMIGDNLQADIHGALKFGVQAIYFNPNRLNYSGTHIQTITQLKDLFK